MSRTMPSGRAPELTSHLERRRQEMALDIPSRLEPGLPRQVDVLVLRALQPDPAKRPGSAGEFLVLLEEARLAGAAKPLEARPD